MKVLFAAGLDQNKNYIPKSNEERDKYRSTESFQHALTDITNMIRDELEGLATRLSTENSTYSELGALGQYQSLDKYVLGMSVKDAQDMPILYTILNNAVLSRDMRTMIYSDWNNVKSSEAKKQFRYEYSYNCIDVLDNSAGQQIHPKSFNNNVSTKNKEDAACNLNKTRISCVFVIHFLLNTLKKGSVRFRRFNKLFDVFRRRILSLRYFLFF